MATVEKFTDLKCWQVGKELAVAVYRVTRKGGFANDYGFRDQIQRAAVSVSSNIAEGFERDSATELKQFLGFAKGSAGEVLSQLMIAKEIGYVDDSDFEELCGKVRFVSVLIARFRSSLSSSAVRGLRWKSPQPCSKAT